MAYTVFKHGKEYGPRKGLEGPFHYPNGRVLYYDARGGEYWDPRTDFYVPIDEVNDLQQSIFNLIKEPQHESA
jgi:hypothetical protein